MEVLVELVEAADMGVPVLVDPAGSVYVLTAELLYLTQQVFPAI